ncbi:hypothetical protein DPMN_100861 [Dreissena polymorpha]|uniref:Uncharacterized protein n=1 Tax=Dreissena polymorpha TaxID=45954 RepID=A0A9D4R7T8_DREPO|nr:hypothetical protein DPMN_100861 [Dreissena polymorpha]
MTQQDETLRMAKNWDGIPSNKQFRTKTKPILVESEGRLQMGTVAKPPARIDQNVNESITGMFKTVNNQIDDDCESNSDEEYVTKAGAIKTLQDRMSKNK